MISWQDHHVRQGNHKHASALFTLGSDDGGNSGLHKFFTYFSNRIAHWAGHPAVFATAALSLIAWAIAGKYLSYSDTWMRILDTTVTIINFLMLFLIQNSQNRDSAAIQIKLAELLRTSEASPDAFLDLEDMPIEELEKLRVKYSERAKKARSGRGVITNEDHPDDA